MIIGKKAWVLDYVWSADEGEWQIWTPDLTGGIIGIGNTKEEAAKSAIANLGLTIADLVQIHLFA